MRPTKTRWSPASTACTTTQAAYARTTSSRIGAPPTPSAGAQRWPANLFGDLLAKIREATSPSSDSTFTTKAPDAVMKGSVCDCLPTQTSRSGGSAETAHTALQVNPVGCPSGPRTVTTETAVTKEAKSALNWSSSIMLQPSFATLILRLLSGVQLEDGRLLHR